MNPASTLRRGLLAAGICALSLCGVAGQAMAQAKIPLRISTPAVPDDWHAKMWTVFKESLDKSSPGQFDVQINLNASLFKQGTEPAAMARGNLELSSISAFDIAKLVPEFSIFTAGYVIRDPQHQQKVFNGPIGQQLFRTVSEKMDVTVLSTIYLGTRQVNLREARNVKTPADLKGVKLRMPPGEGWQFVGTAMGANPTPLAFTEVYTALQTGAIDAQDNPLGAVRSMKFYEVSSQIVKTGHLVANNLFAISLSKWNAMNAAQQKRVQEAADKFADAVTALALKDDVEQETFLKAQGLEIYTPDLAAFRKHVLDAYAKSKFAADWPAGMLDRISKL